MRILRRLRYLWNRRQRQHQLGEEIEEHLTLHIDDLIESGMSRPDAELRARRRFGNPVRIREQSREVWVMRWIDDLFRDLHGSVRLLLRSRAYALIVVLTLALGIGATTAIFSVVNGIFLRPLPYPGAERLMQLRMVYEGGFQGRLFSYPDFEDLQEQNRTFAGLAAYVDRTASAATAEQALRVAWTQVSPGFLSVIGVPPALGRGFSADEEQTGGPVAVVSYRYWQDRLRGRSDLTGESVRVNDRTYTVIGVMPHGYDFPPGTELWAPLEPMTHNRTAKGVQVVGRLRDDVSAAAAQQDLSAIAARLKQQYGDGEDMVDATVRPVLEQLAGNMRAALTVLLGASGALLLVACVNVANLMLARALSRDHESALLLALGAGRAHLIRRFMAESLVLTLAGGGLGLAMAFAGVRALLAQDMAELPRTGEIGVDLRVLVFSLAVSILAASVVGLFPAFRAARRDPRDALADSQRIRGGSAATRRLRAGLVMAQISLTVVLLVGAGLVGRSVLNLLDEDPGYRTDGALVMDVWLPAEEPVGARTAFSANDAYIASFQERLMSGLRMLPGVERVGGINHFPLQGLGANGTYILLDRPDEVSNLDDWERLAGVRSRTGTAQFRVASPDYFGAMEIPLIRGRVFDARDTRDAPHVALISASLAESRWPGQDPVGKLVQFGGMDGDLRPFTIVGIVGDIQEFGIGTPPEPTFYADQRQRPRRATEFHVVILGGGDFAALTRAAREVARELDPQVPVALKTLREVLFAWLADRLFVLVLLALFGVLALALAATGVYGVVGYMAVRRTPEIGVRVALGARGPDVVRLLVREGAVFAVGGVAIGLTVAIALTRVVASWLYGVGGADPTTFAAVAVAMIAVAVAASWVPAYRASRTDAMEALRHD